MMGQYYKIDKTLGVSHVMCHRSCCVAAESDVLARHSVGSFLDCVSKKLQLLNVFRGSYICVCVMILLITIASFPSCSQIYDVILFVDFFLHRPFGMQKLYCFCLTEHVNRSKYTILLSDPPYR